MDALTLLRYWKGNIHGGDKTPTNANVTTPTPTPTGNTTTIVTGISSHASETEDDETDDNGPFFDIEFSLPEQDEAREATDGDDDCDGSESSDELKLTVMSGSSGDSTAVSDSPSHELFFNGGFVPVDRTTEINPKTPQFHKPIMKSATKFRVMMLKFRNLKMNTESSNEETTESKKEVRKQDQTCTEASGNSMTVKFKRRNSSKPSKKRQHENETCSESFEDNKFSKETMRKYLRKVKPLYVRVSQKYGEKLKFNGNLTFPGVIKQNSSPSSATTTTDEQKESSETNPRREKQSSSSEVEQAEPPLLKSTGKALKQQQGNLPAGLRVVCKHFGKTWSASTAIAAATAAAAPGLPPSNRRDDTLLQQEDGIQSAILYCKKSFKGSKDSDGMFE
ncbi:putative membrane-associated kinase regulator [Helianthus annuus]|nr:putative membrane-associated kinase regulator [Helianthus annuus]